MTSPAAPVGAPAPPPGPGAARSFDPASTALLVALGSTWGLSFLFIELALAGLGPLWIVVGRTSLGALTLGIVLRVRRRRMPRDLRSWRHFAILGLTGNAVPWAAVAWAQQTLPSGLTALLMAVVPTSTLLVSVAVGSERLAPARLLGLVLALGGVGATVTADPSDTGRLLATGVVVAATLCYAIGAVYAGRTVAGRIEPLVVATGQVTSAAVIALLPALLLDPLPAAGGLTPTVIGAVGALGVAGTGIAFLVFYALMDRVGPTNATMVTYLVPLVAVVAGALVLDERLGPNVLVGGALIGAGIWLSQRGTKPRTPAAADRADVEPGGQRR